MLQSSTLVLYLLVYVDDIIITIGSFSIHVITFISNLAQQFSLKDLGNLAYFLGIEAHYTSNSLFLSQRKHVKDLLHQLNMVDAKVVSTPLTTIDILKLSISFPSVDATLYHQVVRSS